MTTSLAIRLYRYLRLVKHLFGGLIEVGLIFPIRTPQNQSLAIKRWSQKICEIFDIRIEHHSLTQMPSGHALIVANHISWLDIFVMNAVLPVRFVAKSDVRHWPILGWLTYRVGTLFIEREKRHDTRRVNKAITHILKSGGLVAVFPEGGTTDGLNVGRFKSSLLQPAIEAGVMIHPLTLRYYDHQSERTTIPAYVGEMSLLTSIRQLAASPYFTVKIGHITPLDTIDKNRRELAKIIEQKIATEITSDLPITTQRS